MGKGSFDYNRYLIFLYIIIVNIKMEERHNHGKEMGMVIGRD